MAEDPWAGRGLTELSPGPEHLPLWKEDVEVVVVVVVEERDARPHVLGLIAFARHAVEVDKVETGF